MYNILIMTAVSPIKSDCPEYKGLVRYLDIDIPLRNIYDFIELSRNGIHKKSLLHLAKKINFTLAELAQVIHLSERTIQRYPLNKKLGIEPSAKALQLAKLYTKGENTFGDLDRFNDWMAYPSAALYNKKPKKLLDTTFGFQLIEDELIRISHGIYA